MKYEYYNPDYKPMNCIIRSISKALNVSSENVYSGLIEINNDYQKERVFEKYLKNNGFYIDDTNNGKLLIDTNFDGINIAYTQDNDWYHLVCIINNTIYDKSSIKDLSNMKIIKVYKQKKKEMK